MPESEEEKKKRWAAAAAKSYMTPSMMHALNMSKQQSQNKYKEKFDKTKGKGYTAVASTPELENAKKQSRLVSQNKYKSEFEKNKAKFTQVADDPETKRVSRVGKQISNIEYQGKRPSASKPRRKKDDVTSSPSFGSHERQEKDKEPQQDVKSERRAKETETEEANDPLPQEDALKDNSNLQEGSLQLANGTKETNLEENSTQETTEESETFEESKLQQEPIGEIEDTQPHKETTEKIEDNQQQEEPTDEIEDIQPQEEPTDEIEDIQPQEEPTDAIEDTQPQEEPTDAIEDTQSLEEPVGEGDDSTDNYGDHQQDNYEAEDVVNDDIEYPTQNTEAQGRDETVDESIEQIDDNMDQPEVAEESPKDVEDSNQHDNTIEEGGSSLDDFYANLQ